MHCRHNNRSSADSTTIKNSQRTDNSARPGWVPLCFRKFLNKILRNAVAAQLLVHEKAMRRGHASMIAVSSGSSPRRSKYPTFQVSDSKSHTHNGFGTRNLQYWALGPSGSEKARCFLPSLLQAIEDLRHLPTVSSPQQPVSPENGPRAATCNFSCEPQPKLLTYSGVIVK